MTSLTRTFLYLAIGCALGISLALGQGVFAERNDSTTLPLEDLRTFTEVFAKIKSDYVESVEDKTLLENAIRGMLTGLDPHSAYLVPKDYQDLQAGTSGEFGGLGIEVGMEDGFVKVIAPIDDTPAQRAGVEAGDLIIRLDDTPVKGMSLADAVNLIARRAGNEHRPHHRARRQRHPHPDHHHARHHPDHERAQAARSSRGTATFGSVSSRIAPAKTCEMRSAGFGTIPRRS